MLNMQKVSSESTAVLEEINALYEKAFPACERKSLHHLLEKGQDIGEILAFFDGEQFVGFACTLSTADVTHIIYFAVEEELRNRSYGSQILSEIAAYKPMHRIIVDIERDVPEAENPEQRRMRKAFYLRNGFSETPVKYRWRHCDYQILVRGGSFSQEDFENFWDIIDHTDRKLVY